MIASIDFGILINHGFVIYFVE